MGRQLMMTCLGVGMSLTLKEFINDLQTVYITMKTIASTSKIGQTAFKYLTRMIDVDRYT